MSSKKRKIQNNSPPPQPESFVDKQIRTIETLIDRIGDKLLSEELMKEENLLDTKVQALHRLYDQHLRVHQVLGEKKEKEKEKQTSHEPASETILPQWQNDIVTFAKEALQIDLFGHQKDICQSEKRVNILIAGRGAGKSVAARVKAIHHACCFENHTVLIVSSGQRMSSDFGEKLLQLIRESPAHQLTSSVSQEKVCFRNGSSIVFLPANPDTIRGYHPITAKGRKGMTVILDEACFMENGDDIRKAVEYALITTPAGAGRLYIVSSPSSTGSWVYDYVKTSKQDKTNVKVVQCGSAANPHIPLEEIERLRNTKNELEFRAEVLGEWVDGAYSLFGGLIEDSLIESSSPLPENTYFTLGADLAISYDRTHDRNAVAVVAQYLLDSGEPRYRLAELVVLEHASDLEIRQTVKRLVEKYDITMAAIENYQGKSLAEYTQTLDVETRLIAPTSGMQQMVFHEMHRLLRQQMMDLPRDLPDIFFDEMKSFEYRRSSNGQTAFGHPASGGEHDDTVYAFAWALYAAQEEPPLPSSPSPKPIIQFIDQYD